MSCDDVQEVNILQGFKLFFSIRTDLGELVNPDTHTLTVNGAGFDNETFNITDQANPAVDGEFWIVVTPTAAGILNWYQNADGVGLEPTSSQGYVKVRPLPF